MDFAQLFDLANDMGITVTEGFLPEGWWGAFNALTNTIVLIAGLTKVQRRCTLAHELAHARLNHDQGNPGTEHQARELAAQMLISPQAFALASCREDCGREGIARRLGVLPETVDDYVTWYRRPSNFLQAAAFRRGMMQQWGIERPTGVLHQPRARVRV